MTRIAVPSEVGMHPKSDRVYARDKANNGHIIKPVGKQKSRDVLTGLKVKNVHNYGNF